MEIPKLGAELELQLPAYATATAAATWDRSHVCDLYHSSWQQWIFNPLSEARDWTHILMDTSQAHYRWATTGTSHTMFLNLLLTYMPIHSLCEIFWAVHFSTKNLYWISIKSKNNTSRSRVLDTVGPRESRGPYCTHPNAKQGRKWPGSEACPPTP